MASYFVMVGTQDNPLYEADLYPALKPQHTTSHTSTPSTSLDPLQPTPRDDQKHLNQFVAHSALDVLEELAWHSQSCYLKHVDRFNERIVSAYITPSHVVFLLLHEGKGEEGIKAFFGEVHELWVKVMLNPFYEQNMPVRSFAFDSKVRLLAKKFL